MKHIIIATLLLFVTACSEKEKESESKLVTEEKIETPTYEVKFAGALKNMMHKGDLSAKVDLKDFENIDHLYAIGAFENLKGEIQIFDGESKNTFVQDTLLLFDPTFEKKAALFVYAAVENWKSFDIPSTIKSYEQLEKFVAETANQNNIDITKPFPFLMEGTPEMFDWHVINWKDGDTEHSHEKHISSGLHGTISNTEVDLLGFYSDSHHAIFTHHTTNMHIHVKTKDEEIAGHMDGIVLGEGMVLKLPHVE